MCLAWQKPTRSLHHRIRVGQRRKGRQRQRNSDQEGKKEIKFNRHGLPVLKNGVLSMSHLQLAITVTVPPKARCPNAQSLFDARLTWSKVFTFFSFVKFRHVIPVEKARDESKRMIILHSAAPFWLSDEDYDLILGTDEKELSAT
jgi:hypothetical protein